MCGRFTITKEADELARVLEEQYDIKEFDIEFRPRYNVSPGQEVLSIINDGKKNRVGTLKWGFVPFFASDEKIGYKMINAKAETLAEKPSFKHSFKSKRCIILADGFYEWQKNGKDKTPMRFTLKDEKLFSFAGLWSTFTREDGEKIYTCTIITTSPNTLVASAHDRMPVILDEKREKIWLDPLVTDLDYLSSLLEPYNPELMGVYPVSSVVNSTRVDNPQCIQPI